MTRCQHIGCLRAAIPDGARCEEHTRAALTAAFAPEWVKRAQEHRLPVRVTYR